MEWDGIALGKPMQNGFVERSNGKLRNECLNETLSTNLNGAWQIIEAWCGSSLSSAGIKKFFRLAPGVLNSPSSSFSASIQTGRLIGVNI